ncbi:Serine carboxypeptidase-like 45, partial [Glycine soja]
SVPEADKISNLLVQPHVKFQQYSGYITVDNQNQRALFYYFVEAETDPTSKPVVLWLNGGPGCSFIGAGALVEHGPFKPGDDNVLVKNYYSWNKVANLIYLESPAGVGFSYSSNTSFYTLVTDEITARDNLVFLHHWFTEFPAYSNNDFFITGESYAVFSDNLEIATISIIGSLVNSSIRVLGSGIQWRSRSLLGSRSLVNGLAKELGLNTTVAYKALFEGKHVNT